MILSSLELKEGCAKNSRIYDIIDKNICLLGSIDVLIDTEFKIYMSRIKTVENLELNKRSKNLKAVYLRNEEKFEGAIDEFIENKAINFINNQNKARNELRDLKIQFKISDTEYDDDYPF